ncbi:gliding motility-associated protein GldE [Porphyromonas sp. COT-290 OH3588]|uniref:gliding motility-associated protein GldE n=1 Tax=Porphyromonas sp. COT-290 OH3588 TaxID=1515617 RepID=UPI00052E425B|nr:gliding motility-associated protein GldE [Porphyromonas sp. COT-290 OH3588]KGO01197.1 hemolysin [Porphyromonas sp. COT-290 OH3588]
MADPILYDIISPNIPIGAWVALAIGAGLLFASGFMSSSEVAFFSLRPAELDDVRRGEHPADEALYRLLSDPERLLATILIGNNLVNIAIVILMGYGFSLIFDFSDAMILGFIFQTVILTLLLLLFGEIIPKVYAQSNPLGFSRTSAPYMRLVDKLLRPCSSFLVRSTKIITKRMQRKRYDISMDDLSQAVDLLNDKKVEEKTMFEEIISFYGKTASEIMVPRIDMLDIDISWDFHRMLQFALDCGYSRIPVYETSEDNIRGIIYVKDLILHKDKPADFQWTGLLRPAYFVPENKPLDDLLEELRSNKIHMAIVVDEYGGTSGLVTMEDILEEIVGNISDEYDEEELPYKKQADGSYLFEAKTPLGDVLRYLDLEPGTFGKCEEEVDTLGGLYLEIKQDLPRLQDTVQAGAWSLRITELEKFRIITIQLIPPTAP